MKHPTQGSRSQILLAYTLPGGPEDRSSGTIGDARKTKEHGDLAPWPLQQIDVFLLPILSTHHLSALPLLMSSVSPTAILWGQVVTAHL